MPPPLPQSPPLLPPPTHTDLERGVCGLDVDADDSLSDSSSSAGSGHELRLDDVRRLPHLHPRQAGDRRMLVPLNDVPLPPSCASPSPSPSSSPPLSPQPPTLERPAGNHHRRRSLRSSRSGSPVSPLLPFALPGFLSLRDHSIGNLASPVSEKDHPPHNHHHHHHHHPRSSLRPLRSLARRLTRLLTLVVTVVVPSAVVLILALTVHMAVRDAKALPPALAGHIPISSPFVNARCYADQMRLLGGNLLFQLSTRDSAVCSEDLAVAHFAHDPWAAGTPSVIRQDPLRLSIPAVAQDAWDNVTSSDTAAVSMEWVTFATSCSGGINRFAATVRDTGIPLTVLGFHTPWRGWGQRLRSYHAYARTVAESDPARVLILSDANDVIVTPGTSARSLLDAWSLLVAASGGGAAGLGRIVAGSESALWPDEGLAAAYRNKDTIYRPAGVRDPRLQLRWEFAEAVRLAQAAAAAVDHTDGVERAADATQIDKELSVAPSLWARYPDDPSAPKAPPAPSSPHSAGDEDAEAAAEAEAATLITRFAASPYAAFGRRPPARPRQLPNHLWDGRGSPLPFLNAGFLMGRASDLALLLSRAYTNDCADDQLALHLALLRPDVAWVEDDAGGVPDEWRRDTLAIEDAVRHVQAAEADAIAAGRDPFGDPAWRTASARVTYLVAAGGERAWSAASSRGVQRVFRAAALAAVDRYPVAVPRPSSFPEESPLSSSPPPPEARPLLVVDTDADLAVGMYQKFFVDFDVNSAAVARAQQRKRRQQRRPQRGGNDDEVDRAPAEAVLRLRMTGGRPSVLHQSGRKVENRVLEQLAAVFGLPHDRAGLARAEAARVGRIRVP
ncbi:hypothetical protein HK405_007692 [Cladochytrium tenue]|nr:hypothetical protein HK405_007692 [Cladochytrium tenue]